MHDHDLVVIITVGSQSITVQNPIPDKGLVPAALIDPITQILTHLLPKDVSTVAYDIIMSLGSTTGDWELSLLRIPFDSDYFTLITPAIGVSMSSAQYLPRLCEFTAGLFIHELREFMDYELTG